MCLSAGALEQWEVELMAGFAVIDFETANEQRGSPCAVGYALVEGLEVVSSDAFLIRPPEFRFESFNVSLHGVTSDMCRSAPAWPDALGRLTDIIESRLVVAHYAPFDIGVIQDACALSDTPYPELRFACTRQISRCVWPELGSYSLPDVVSHCQAGEFDHHDAKADALAAAAIAAAATRAKGADSLDDLIDLLHIAVGTLHEGQYVGSHRPRSMQGGHGTYTAVPRNPSEGAVADPDHPFYGKKIAFTGGMMSMTRQQAQQAVVDVGGRGISSVSKLTDFVVVGGEFHGLLAGHEASSKLEKALDLREQGCKVELLDEVDFLSVLSWECQLKVAPL